MSERILRGALGATLLLVLAACSEQVTGTIGCPALCTDQSAGLRDTVLTASVTLDSTLMGYPRLGESRDVTLISQGDTADIRAIVRYDTLPSRYVPTAPQADSLIRRVDSATFIFRVDTTMVPVRVPVTIDAFDVDTTASDTAVAVLAPLFRADRLLGSVTYAAADVKDTLRLPLDNAKLLAKMAAGSRLRIGLRVRAAQSVRLRFSGSVTAPLLRFRVSADTLVKPDSVTPVSRTPASDLATAANLAIFPLVVRGALPPPPAGRLAVGGVAGARVYMRFDIPSIVLDSVQVVRASLELTQLTPRSPGANSDSLTLGAFPVLANPGVADVRTAADFLGAGTVYNVPPVTLKTGDSGLRTLQLIKVVQLWQAVGTTNNTRALVLRVQQEAGSVSELNFVSLEGPAAQRPRLHLTYVPRRGFGLP